MDMDQASYVNNGMNVFSTELLLLLKHAHFCFVTAFELPLDLIMIHYNFHS